MNKYFYISNEKENVDTQKLVDKIKEEGWVDSNTIIVNCSPDYSSRLTQTVNHRLSHLNGNELFECINLEMPYPIMSQIYNSFTKSYEMFDRYLADWTKQYVSPSNNYLFIDSGTLRGKNFNKVKIFMKSKLEPANMRFASLYVEKSSIFHPDYFVESFDSTSQGGLLFQWENADNPNWDY